MTVKELIVALERIKNKNLEVIVVADDSDYGGDVYSVITDFWTDAKQNKKEYCEIHTS